MKVKQSFIPPGVRHSFAPPLRESGDSFTIPKGANLLLKVGDTKLKVQIEGATIKAPKLSRLRGKRCMLR